jgi:hypothetical protein
MSLSLFCNYLIVWVGEGGGCLPFYEVQVIIWHKLKFKKGHSRMLFLSA